MTGVSRDVSLDPLIRRRGWGNCAVGVGALVHQEGVIRGKGGELAGWLGHDFLGGTVVRDDALRVLGAVNKGQLGARCHTEKEVWCAHDTRCEADVRVIARRMWLPQAMVVRCRMPICRGRGRRRGRAT